MKLDVQVCKCMLPSSTEARLAAGVPHKSLLNSPACLQINLQELLYEPWRGHCVHYGVKMMMYKRMVWAIMWGHGMVFGIDQSVGHSCAVVMIRTWFCLDQGFHSGTQELVMAASGFQQGSLSLRNHGT